MNGRIKKIRIGGMRMQFDQLSSRVIGCAIEGHRALGPRLLESSYEKCLAHELALAGIASRLSGLCRSGTKMCIWTADIE